MAKNIKPKRRMAVDILILSDPYATVAEATILNMGVGVLDGGLFVATGSAKKNKGDVYDPVIDVDLAVGRALRGLGGQMVKSGNRRVRAATMEQSKKRVETRLVRHRPGRHEKPLTIKQIKKLHGDEHAERAKKLRAARRQQLG